MFGPPFLTIIRISFSLFIKQHFSRHAWRARKKNERTKVVVAVIVVVVTRAMRCLRIKRRQESIRKKRQTPAKGTEITQHHLSMPCVLARNNPSFESKTTFLFLGAINNAMHAHTHTMRVIVRSIFIFYFRWAYSGKFLRMFVLYHAKYSTGSWRRFVSSSTPNGQINAFWRVRAVFEQCNRLLPDLADKSRAMRNVSHFS